MVPVVLGKPRNTKMQLYPWLRKYTGLKSAQINQWTKVQEKLIYEEKRENSSSSMNTNLSSFKSRIENWLET